MMAQIQGNWICWVMLVVALVSYQQLFVAYLTRHQQELSDSADQTSVTKGIPAVLVAALPLMGLLGTIMGLQQSFVGMSVQGSDSQLVSGGIADALVTTQLGLVLAVPGWLLMLYVDSAVKRAQVDALAEAN